MAWGKKGTRSPQAIEKAWRRSLRAAVAGDWASAETWLEQIVQADSSDLDAYHALARLYRQQGAVGRAIRMHQNLLHRADLDSDARLEALLELARDFDAGGFAQRAIASFEEALGRQPRNAEILERLIALLSQEHEYARALALVRRLRRRNRALADPLEVEILLAQAQSQYEEGEHDGARQSLKRCLRRDKTCAGAWAMLGELEAQRGKDARALDAWKRGAAADVGIAAALYPKIGATFASRGKPAEYERFLRGLLEERPDDQAARIALARTLAGRGESVAAIEELARAIEVAPEHFGLHAELGRQLLASGQDAEALKAYAEVIETLEHASGGELPETVA